LDLMTAAGHHPQTKYQNYLRSLLEAGG